MTPEEKLTYFHKLGMRVLSHRYRYYVLDWPALTDFQYDYLERLYEALAAELGLDPITKNLVGFSETDENCVRARELVDAEQDDYSLWLAEMKPIWQEKGLPVSWQRNTEDSKS